MYNLKPPLNCFVWFSFFGPNHLNLSHNLHVVRFLFKVSKIIFVILLIASLVQPFKEDLMLTSTINYVIICVSFITVPLDLIEIIEGWINSDTLISVIYDFEEYFKCLNTFCDVRILRLNFVRMFRNKCILCTFLFLAEFIVRISTYSELLKIHSRIILSMAVLYKNFAIVHIVLCIDLNGMILSSLNDQLRSSSSDMDTEFSIISAVNPETIALFKCTTNSFQRVSRISENVNKRFGWFMLSVFLNNIVGLIRAAIAVFMALMIWTNTFDILRKSIHVEFLINND